MTSTCLPRLLAAVGRLREQVEEARRALARAAEGCGVPRVLWQLVSEYACDGWFETRVGLYSAPCCVLAVRDESWWTARDLFLERGGIQIESTHFQGLVHIPCTDKLKCIAEGSDGSLLVLHAPIRMIHCTLTCSAVSRSGRVTTLWETKTDTEAESPMLMPPSVSADFGPRLRTIHHVGWLYQRDLVWFDPATGTRLGKWTPCDSQECDLHLVNSDVLVDNDAGARVVRVISLVTGQVLGQWPYPGGENVSLWDIDPFDTTARFVDEGGQQGKATACDLLTGRILRETSYRGVIGGYYSLCWSGPDNHVYQATTRQDGQSTVYLLL